HLRRPSPERPRRRRGRARRAGISGRSRYRRAEEGQRMTYITKPKVRHPALPVNDLGLTPRDYEGGMSTLCAGCGHDSITAAIIQTVFELSIPPHRIAKLS